jgi:hypothetical protein
MDQSSDSDFWDSKAGGIAPRALRIRIAAETLPADGAELVHFCSLCGAKFHSMRIRRKCATPPAARTTRGRGLDRAIQFSEAG